MAHQSPEKAYDFLVFIGRFQPLHDGHVAVIQQALAQAHHVIILVGSANAPRSNRNPFTYDEREHMMQCVFPNEVRSGDVVIAPLDDIGYSDPMWIAQVQQIVNTLVSEWHHTYSIQKRRNKYESLVVNDGYKSARIGLIGFSKDGSSYYLKKFPQWGSVAVNSQYSTFNSTEIRDHYFQNAPILPHDIAPKRVVDFMKSFMHSEAFIELVREQQFLKRYREMWTNTPYPVNFVTTDCIVVQSGHILLIRRGEHPGKGQLALPGGFLNPNESIEDCAVRELKEETRIADHLGEIPPAKLRSFIVGKTTYDNPNRDPRGRAITHAFLFKLPDANPLYMIRGSDDAASAAWHPLGSLDPREFFLDHYHIIQDQVQEL